MSNIRETVDWTNFDQYPESTVTCVCGYSYRSHAKFVVLDEKTHGIAGGCVIARKLCAMCGSERMRGSRSDPETVTL